MNTHLTEDMLIKYQFDLLDEGEKKISADHLADCDQCRSEFEELVERFSLLDVLNDEMEVSDELLQKTVASSLVSKPAKTSVFPLRRVGWIASAAAVLVVGIIFFANGPDKEIAERTNVQPITSAADRVEDFGYPDLVAAGDDSVMADKSSMNLHESENLLAVGSSGVTNYDAVSGEKYWYKKDPLDSYAVGLKAGTKGVMNGLGTVARSTSHAAGGVRVVDSKFMPDKPPFAPASAIELVVLPRPEEMQVTIYNSADLTLVSDKRKLTLKPGYNWLQFMWANTKIDPTSLSLRPLEHDDKIDIEQLVYPAGLKDIGRWLIRSQVEGAVEFEITYFASGLSWRAFYMGTMNQDETKMGLKGYVRVANNSGQDYDNAKTRLIVGQTRLIEPLTTLAGRYYPYGPDVKLGAYGDWNREGHNVLFGDGHIPLLGDLPVIGGMFRNGKLKSGIDLSGGMGGGMWDMDSEEILGVKEVAKEGLSEYFLYTIDGTENLTNGWAKRLPSMDVEGIPVKSLYKYDDSRYGKTPVRFVSFANDDEHELGETPLPDGAMKIYRHVNADMNLSYVGGTEVKYIPVNEDVELNLGGARLVKVEPVLMAKSTENITFDGKGNIDGYDEIEEYKVTVTNTREIPIDMEITWNMGTVSWELDMDDKTGTVEYKKHDSRRGRFTMTVKPRSDVAFTNTIRKYRDKRQEAYVEKMKELQK